MSRRLSRRIMWLTGLCNKGRSVFGILQCILKAILYTHILLSVLAFLHFPTGCFLSLPPTAVTTKADHCNGSLSRKVITFPYLFSFQCNRKGLRLSSSKAVQNFESRIYLIRFRLNKAFQAGRIEGKPGKCHYH